MNEVPEEMGTENRKRIEEVSEEIEEVTEEMDEAMGEMGKNQTSSEVAGTLHDLPGQLCFRFKPSRLSLHHRNGPDRGPVTTDDAQRKAVEHKIGPGGQAVQTVQPRICHNSDTEQRPLQFF